MNNEQEILARLEKLEEQEQKRLRQTKIQLALIAVLVIIVAVTVFIVVPKVNGVCAQAQELMAGIDPGVLNRLERLDVDALNTTITSINKAIAALEDVVAPIMNFFAGLGLGG